MCSPASGRRRAVCDRRALARQDDATGQPSSPRRRTSTSTKCSHGERPDLVSLCLPNEGHYDTTMRVIEAGYPLLVEKPLVFDLAEADRLLRGSRGTRALLRHQLQPPLRPTRADGPRRHRLRRARAHHVRDLALRRRGRHQHPSVRQPHRDPMPRVRHARAPLRPGRIGERPHERSGRTRATRTMAVALSFASGAVGALVGSYDSSYAYPDTHYVEVNGSAGRVQVVDTVKRFTHSCPVARRAKCGRPATSTTAIATSTTCSSCTSTNCYRHCVRGEEPADPRPRRSPRPAARRGVHPVPSRSPDR